MAPVTGIAAAAHHSAGRCSASGPIEAAAAAICPADSVTWRTSRPMPKKAANAGARPSMKPSEMLEAKPEMWVRMKPAQRRARFGPSTAPMRGLWRSAESSRCSTKAFSVQPATMLAANSSTPVKAA
jgi:hypothetical protein